MMRLYFLFPTHRPYNSQSVRNLPCGGTEKAVIFLGEALQELGHEVEWFTTPDEINTLLDDGEAISKADVVVAQVASLFQAFPKATKVWWTHHFSDQPVIQQGAAFGRCFADHIVTLSPCHQQDIRQALRLESMIIPHGIWYDELAVAQAKVKGRMIYASTPFRGLERLPGIFKRVQEAIPGVSLVVCSSMATYGKPEEDVKYQPCFDELRQIPGVSVLGSLNQQDLYDQYAQAEIMLYPSNWRETYCIAADEALAHLCQPVTSGLAALERFGPALETDEEIAQAAIKALIGPRVFHMGDNPHPWKGVAQMWINMTERAM